MNINIAYLYYDLMNLYGESGNIKALVYSLKGQNINVNVDYDIEDILDEDRKNVLNAIINYFGYYSGPALVKMSHIESPWRATRTGLQPDENSNKIISKNSIKSYFKNVKEKYNIINPQDIQNYSQYLFSKIIKS